MTRRKPDIRYYWKKILTKHSYYPMGVSLLFLETYKHTQKGRSLIYLDIRIQPIPVNQYEYV